MEQLAHVGSEVSRALNWRQKNRPEMAQNAFDRSLELFDLTLACPANRERLGEVARARECWTDFFLDAGGYLSTETSWRKYFLQFAEAARKSA